MREMTVADEAELYLRILADPDSEPGEHECLACYVARMLSAHGCDTTLRWAQRFRDVRVPAATGLERRLGQVGGFCDCEIFLNGYQLVRELMEEQHKEMLRNLINGVYDNVGMELSVSHLSGHRYPRNSLSAAKESLHPAGYTFVRFGRSRLRCLFQRRSCRRPHKAP